MFFWYEGGQFLSLLLRLKVIVRDIFGILTWTPVHRFVNDYMNAFLIFDKKNPQNIFLKLFIHHVLSIGLFQTNQYKGVSIKSLNSNLLKKSNGYVNDNMKINSNPNNKKKGLITRVENGFSGFFSSFVILTSIKSSIGL